MKSANIIKKGIPLTEIDFIRCLEDIFSVADIVAKLKTNPNLQEMEIKVTDSESVTLISPFNHIQSCLEFMLYDIFKMILSAKGLSEKDSAEKTKKELNELYDFCKQIVENDPYKYYSKLFNVYNSNRKDFAKIILMTEKEQELLSGFRDLYEYDQARVIGYVQNSAESAGTQKKKNNLA